MLILGLPRQRERMTQPPTFDYSGVSPTTTELATTTTSTTETATSETASEGENDQIDKGTHVWQINFEKCRIVVLLLCLNILWKW